MKKLLILALAANCISAMAQSDPVLMTINGKDVTRSEFEYSYNKNNSDGVIDKKSIEDYVPLFIDFKLKVAAAEDARYDTITSIQKELRGYKEQMVLPTIIDKDFIERQARETYDNTAARFEGEDLLTNDLEIPSIEKIPEIGLAIKALLDSGAAFSRMTGSGSAVFAMYENEETRDAAFDKIKNDPEFSGCEVFVSKTI